MSSAVVRQKLAELSARIFGNAIGNGLPSGHKVLRKPLIGEKVASYYPIAIEKFDPFFEDPDEEYWKTKAERARRRGKGTPKKGQGKRAQKRG
ncbi:hypothetical protein CYMTET_19529 [Cymbomonas tetramitiformis]|uniref:Small ribosomal subunit protein mS33 n=1 Tax=Cymbomonas tetramitiformis TaxID=36881 RepID=A0AAE0G5V3_9CHLO|nr:hypothetical protein CYMTET_19529 [Cymbomonas tetramitiformis]